MSVQNNVSAMNAYRNLSQTQNDLGSSLEKLSSGFRINRAADDAAGLAISEGLRSQIGGLNVAVRNAQDGISVVQTAEGALNETHSILQRMRDLSVQASNTGGLSDTAKSNIQAEMDELAEGLNDISEQTQFNGTKLLDGGYDGTFQVGANVGETISVTIDQGMSAVSLGIGALDVTNAATSSVQVGTEADGTTAIEVEMNGAEHAIHLIDEAPSRIRMEIDSKPEELDRLDRRLIQLKIEREALKKEDDEATKKRLAKLEDDIAKLEREYADLEEIWKSEKAEVQGSAQIQQKIEQAKAELEAARRKGDLARMAELQYGIIPDLERSLEMVDQHGKKENQLLRNKVTDEEIAEVVSKWTGIPVSKMLEGERDKLLRMEDMLHTRVIGQHEAVVAVSNAVRRSRAGLADPNRPSGSFLFLGPTGVGKTELCKALAEFLFDTEEAMIRIDMSEFMEKHSVARLIGAPPGYVGYEEGGYLTEAVRRKPYSVVLMDEVEKAHPDVFNVLLQVLEDGRLTDSHGRTVDFKNTVIVMTSNLGSAQIQELVGDPDAQRAAVMDAVAHHFRPEFINRIDEVVVFDPLGREQIAGIADIQLGRLRKRLAERELSLELSQEAMDKLIAIGYDPVYGARPLKRAIQRWIENPLAQQILSGQFAPGSSVKARVEGEQIVFD